MNLLLEAPWPARPMSCGYAAGGACMDEGGLGDGEIRLLLRGVSRRARLDVSAGGGAGGPAWRGLSGIVHARGDRVRTLSAGDEVFGVAELGSRHDADGLIVSANDFSRQPARVSFLDAASLACTAAIAWQMLFKVGRLERGETVLVLGGETPVGRAAVRLATLHGVRTVALISRGHESAEARAWADRVIDTAAGRIEAQSRLAAVVVDTLGGTPYRRARAVVRAGSSLVSCVEGCRLSPKADVRFLGRPEAAAGCLARIRELIEAGLLDAAG